MQLPLIDITGVVSDAADIPPVLAGSEYSTGQAPRGKLSEGWHDTEKYGPIFVSPVRESLGASKLSALNLKTSLSMFQSVILSVHQPLKKEKNQPEKQRDDKVHRVSGQSRLF